MNFRYLAIILIAIIAFSACTQAPPPAAEVETAAETGAAEAAADPAPPATTETDDADHLDIDPRWAEPLTVSFASVQVRGGVDYNDCIMSHHFRDPFNITWDMVSLTWDNWAEMLRIWISAGDMPDMATWDYQHGEAVTFARDGLVRRMPDNWKQRWPHTAAAVESSTLGPAIEEMMGGTYFLPKPIFAANKPVDPLVGHQMVTLRRDWLEAVGAEIKFTYTVSELIDIARAFQEHDPDGLGSALVPMSFHRYSAARDIVGRQFAHFNTFYLGEDGTYQWGPANPAVLEGLRLYQTAVREGLTHPDFFLWRGDEDIQHFRTLGVAGMMLNSGMASIQQDVWADLRSIGLDPHEVFHAAVVLGEDGMFHEREVINFWTTLIFSPDLPEADFERIMYLVDYVATEESQLTIRMGFEGVDWERDGQGGFNMLIPEDVIITDKYPSIHPLYGNMIILSDDFHMINPALLPELRAITAEMYATKARLSNEVTVPRTDWNVQFHDSNSMRMVGFNFNDVFTELIMQDGDLETNWREWIAAQAPLVNPVIEELNALIR